MWEPHMWPWGSPPPGIMSTESSFSRDGTDPDSQFCLRWNSHLSNLTESIGNVQHSEDTKASTSSFADVTLSCCDGVKLIAHRIVLASSSTFFCEIFKKHNSAGTNDHTVVILNDIFSSDMKILLNYIYNGQVNVNKEDMNRILSLATQLRIKGLTHEISEMYLHEAILNDSEPQELTVKNFKKVNSTSTPVDVKSVKYDPYLRMKTENSMQTTPLSRPSSPRIKLKKEFMDPQPDIKPSVSELNGESEQNRYSPVRPRSPNSSEYVSPRSNLFRNTLFPSFDHHGPIASSPRPGHYPQSLWSQSMQFSVNEAVKKNLLNEEFSKGEALGIKYQDSSPKKRQRTDAEMNVIPPLVVTADHKLHLNNPYFNTLGFSFNPFDKTRTLEPLSGLRPADSGSIQDIANFNSIKDMRNEDILRKATEIKPFLPSYYSNANLPAPYDYSELLNKHSLAKIEREETPAIPQTSPNVVSASSPFSSSSPAFPGRSTPSFPNPFPSTSPPSTSSKSSEASTGSSKLGQQQYTNNSFVSYNPGAKPEWKRYKQYSKKDLQLAIDAVQNGTTALQASRRFKVPSRTLYDKIKKLGIHTSSNRRMVNGSKQKNGVNSSAHKMDYGYDRNDIYNSEVINSCDSRSYAERDLEGQDYNRLHGDRYDSRPQSVESSATNDSLHPLDLHIQKPKTPLTSETVNVGELHSLYSSLANASANNIPTTIEHLNQPRPNSDVNFPLGSIQNHYADQLRYLTNFRNRLGTYVDKTLQSSSLANEEIIKELTAKCKMSDEDCEVVVDSDGEKEPMRKFVVPVNGSEYETSDYASQITNNAASSSDSPPSYAMTTRDSGIDSNNDLYDNELKKRSNNNVNNATGTKVPNVSPEPSRTSDRTEISPKTSVSSVSQVSPLLSDKSSASTDSDYEALNNRNKKPASGLLSDMGLCSQVRPLDLRENIPIPQETI